MTEIVIKYSKKWLGIYMYSSVACLVIAIVSGILLFLKNIPMFSPHGAVTIWFAATAFILFSLRYVTIIIIGDAGLKIGSFKSIIPWTQIESVSIRSFLFQKILMIKFDKSYNSKIDQLFLFLWKIIFFWFQGSYDFYVNISFLELKPNNILSIIEDRISEQKNPIA